MNKLVLASTATAAPHCSQHTKVFKPFGKIRCGSQMSVRRRSAARVLVRGRPMWTASCCEASCIGSMHSIDIVYAEYELDTFWRRLKS
jgi:hypothetical protein